MNDKYIVTHVVPDWDAIGTCWFLQRHCGCEDMDVVFVNTANPPEEILRDAWAVADTGRVFNAQSRRFDHHQLDGNTSAMALVYEEYCTMELSYIKPIVEMINAADCGSNEYGARWSRIVGIHALLQNAHTKGMSNRDLLLYGYDLLDGIAAGLLAKQEAKQTLENFIAYCSHDGLVVALANAPMAATQAAFEAGAQLVVFHSEAETTVSVGVRRGGGNDALDVGKLVEITISATPHTEVAIELATWFRHGSGFFAGRGTAKAPDNRPLKSTVTEIARTLDLNWRRGYA